MNSLLPPPPPPFGPPPHPPIHPSPLLIQQGIASKYLGGKPICSNRIWSTDNFFVVSGRTSGETDLLSSI